MAFLEEMRLRKYIAYLLERSFSSEPKVVEDELVSAFSEKFTEDRKPRKQLTLEEHDKIEHPNGFDPNTMTCKFRENLKKKDAVDLIYATSDVHHSGIEDITDKECGTIVLAGDFMEKAKHSIDFDNAAKWWDDKFIPWCEDHKDQQIVIIGGNCDKWLYKNRDNLEWPQNVHYLDDTETEVNGMRVYGTSWCPHNMNGAWEVDNDVLEKEFSKIPEGLDILVTHVPPKGEGIDLDHDTEFNNHFGSEALTKAILEKKPKIVLCGHVHSGPHKPIKIGDSIVMNVSRIDDDRYEKAFHGRRIGVERTDNGLGFLVDMDDEGRMSLGKKEDIPKSILRLRDVLREAARRINRYSENPRYNSKPDGEISKRVYKAIASAEKDMESFDHPKKKMIEAGIQAFKDSEESGFTKPMSRIGKMFDGDKNGVDKKQNVQSHTGWWKQDWNGFGSSVNPSVSQGHISFSQYKGSDGSYKSPWVGGMSIDDILSQFEKKQQSKQEEMFS